ncbi:9354_t:CDS:2, partial [Entrophospora sp. SA101]
RKLTPYIRHIHFNSPPTTYSYEWRASLEDNPLTKLWAYCLGIGSMFLASVQYIPQIYRTWKRK